MDQQLREDSKKLFLAIGSISILNMILKTFGAKHLNLYPV